MKKPTILPLICLALAWPAGASAQSSLWDRTRDAGLSGWRAVTGLGAGSYRDLEEDRDGYADPARPAEQERSPDGVPPVDLYPESERHRETESGNPPLEAEVDEPDDPRPGEELLTEQPVDEVDPAEEPGDDLAGNEADEPLDEPSPELLASLGGTRTPVNPDAPEIDEPRAAASDLPADGTMPAVGIDAIPVCYNFGCKVKDIVAIREEDWDSVANFFAKPAATPEEERQQIKKAVGWMEVVIGRYTPTHRDVPGDLPPGTNFPGQLDCIDESLNTTTYMKLFERNGLLRWHRVVERARRAALFDQHYSGQIEEKATGKRFIVDSWFQANGYLPYVQRLEEWMDIPFFTSYLDNSTETGRRASLSPDSPSNASSRID